MSETFETTDERERRETAEAAQAERARFELLRQQQQAVEFAAQQKKQETATAIEEARHEEERLASRARLLPQLINTAQQEALGLRREITTERDLAELHAEAADLVASLARRNLASIRQDPRDVDQLNRVKEEIASWWPARKVVLIQQAERAEANAKALEKELNETRGLFGKAQAAYRRLRGRGDKEPA